MNQQQHQQQAQMAKHVRRIYNYNVGHPAAVGKIIIICLLASPVVGLVVGLLAFIRHTIGW